MTFSCSTSAGPRAPGAWSWGNMCAHARLSAFPLFPPFLPDGTLLINRCEHAGLTPMLTSGPSLVKRPRPHGQPRLGLPICWGHIRICRRLLNITTMVFALEVLWRVLHWRFWIPTFERGRLVHSWGCLLEIHRRGSAAHQRGLLHLWMDDALRPGSSCLLCAHFSPVV